jgi:hypothetical protein
MTASIEISFLILWLAFLIAAPLFKGKDWAVSLCLLASMACLMVFIIAPLFSA